MHPGVGIGVTGRYVDTVLPTVSTMVLGSLADNRIVITCSEALDTGSVPAVGDFALAGISLPISSVSVQGSTVWLIFGDNIPDNYTLTLSYTAGANPIRDAAHNNLANFVTQAVTNSSSDHADVVLSIAFVATQFVFKWKAPAGNDVTFHEGDGTTQTVSGNDAAEVTTTFSHVGAGTYDVWLSGDDAALTYIDISSQAFVSGSVVGLSALTDLTYLCMHSTGMTGSVDGLSVLNNLTYLCAYSTSVSGDASALSTLTSATTVWLGFTSVTFDNAPAWTNASAIIYFHSCAMTSVMVNNMIESFSTCTDCTINIAGTNAHRTAASNDDLNTLLANGNTITLNDTLSAEKITNGDFTLGADLNVSNCENYNYDSFTNVTPNGFDVVGDGSSSMFASTADEISFVSGQKYIITVDKAQTSGTVPSIDIRSAVTGSVIIDEAAQTLDTGSNVVEFTCNITTTGVVRFFTIASATNYQITNLSVKDAAVTQWTAGTGWYAGGVNANASYDDGTDDTGLVQADGDMVSVVAVDTVYRAEFTTNATPTNAAIAIKNAAEDVVYFAQANYTDDTHVKYFTTPADVKGGGIAFVAYQAGDAFDLDNVSLKTVTSI